MARLNTYTDQMGYAVQLASSPQRIISLVPSQTETLLALGIGKRLIGITTFCIHPKAEVQSIQKIGGTKNPRISDILALNPDFIIANKEENRLEDIAALKNHCPVWLSDINTPEDSLGFIASIGEILELPVNGLIDELTQVFHEVHKKRKRFNQRHVHYLIWRKPYMLAGKSTYIDSCLRLAGFHNATTEERYPEWHLNAPIAPKSNLYPDLILLSSEPYPFKDKHIKELKKEFAHADILLVDGELFSWYGVRQLGLAQYLNKLELSLSH